MKNIVLIGMMGSGKTTIGRLLSLKTGFKLIDTDAEIEKKNRMKISEIFAKFGENAFRHIEEETIEELRRPINKIIATGGGTVLNSRNFDFLKRNGDMVYLKTSADDIYERVKGDTTRPLLQTSDPKQKIEELLEQRADIYEKADIIVDTNMKTPEQIVVEIVEELEKNEI